MLFQLSETDDLSTELEAVLAAAGRKQKIDYPSVFNNSLARFVGLTDACVVSSDSAAVSTLIGALDLKAGSQVLVAAHLRTSFVFPLLFSGLRPVFVDCLALDLTIDITAICNAMTSDIVAMFIAAPWGIEQELRGLRSALDEHARCPIILDATDCISPLLSSSNMPASVDVMLLSLGEGSSSLSIGEGGAIVSNDTEIVKRADYYQRFAGLEGNELGINQKTTSMQAALGIHRLHRLSVINKQNDRLLNGLRERLISTGHQEGVVAALGNYVIVRTPIKPIDLKLMPVVMPQAHRLAACSRYTRPCPHLDRVVETFSAFGVSSGGVLDD